MHDYRLYSLRGKEILMLTVFCVVSSTLIGWMFYDTYIGIALAPFIFYLTKKTVESLLAERRRRALRNQFRDVLYSFSSSFAAGAHMEEAMEISAFQIGELYGEDSYMEKELLYMIKKMRETAGGDVELWNDLAIRSGLEDIEDFARVFAACRDSGGDLVQAVDRASVLIVEKINIENEMRTLFSQKKTEGRMVGVMPLMMILFLRITSPSYLDVMYESILGRILMTIAALSMIYSIYMTEKITRIEV